MKTSHPLHIAIPRSISKEGSVKDYYDLVRKHGQSRKAMVGFITGIGGYYDRHDRYAIEFSVKAHYYDFDKESLWAFYLSDEIELGPEAHKGEDPGVVSAAYDRAYAEHHGDLFNWGVEEAQESVHSDDIAYETWLGERVEWTPLFLGRSGGHLCMESCEGIDLRCSPEDLEEELLRCEGGVWDVSHETLRKLFIICVQNSVDFTPRKASKEVMHRAAWRLWSSFVEPYIEEAKEEREATTVRDAHIRTVRHALDSHGDAAAIESFNALI